MRTRAGHSARTLRSRESNPPEPRGKEPYGGKRPAMFPPTENECLAPRTKPPQIMPSFHAPAHAQFAVALEIEMPCQRIDLQRQIPHLGRVNMRRLRMK